MEENPYWAPFDRIDAEPVHWPTLLLAMFGAICQMSWPIVMHFNFVAGFAVLVVGVIAIQVALRRRRRERRSA